MTCSGYLRRLRGPLCPRDARAGPRRARGGWQEMKDDPAFQLELEGAAARLRRAAHAALSRRAPRRRKSDLPEARRPLPHRRAQDQQRDRPGAHREAHGQAAHHRGDRRGPARRRDRDRLRAASGCECVVYMGEEDMARQAPNVFRMRLLGAEVVPVESAARTLKDATTKRSATGSRTSKRPTTSSARCVGPHPYPKLVRDFQSVIGREAREQILAGRGRLPDAVVACVGGGSNAIGLFHGFSKDTECADRRRGGRARRAWGGRAGRPPRRALVAARGRGRPDRGRALDLRRASTIRASAPSTRSCATPAAPSTRRDRRRGPRRFPSARRARRDHPGTRARHTRSPAP